MPEKKCSPDSAQIMAISENLHQALAPDGPSATERSGEGCKRCGGDGVIQTIEGPHSDQWKEYACPDCAPSPSPEAEEHARKGGDLCLLDFRECEHGCNWLGCTGTKPADTEEGTNA